MAKPKKKATEAAKSRALPKASVKKVSSKKIQPVWSTCKQKPRTGNGSTDPDSDEESSDIELSHEPPTKCAKQLVDDEIETVDGGSDPEVELVSDRDRDDTILSDDKVKLKLFYDIRINKQYNRMMGLTYNTR